MAEPFSRWQLAVCSGRALFLAAVLALHPGARFQGRSVARLLKGLTPRFEPVLLLATDDLPDGSALDLIGGLRQQLGTVPLRVVLYLEDQLDRERLLAYLRAGVQAVQRLETFDGTRLTATMERAVQDGPGLDANLDPHYVGLLVKELQPQGPIELAEQLVSGSARCCSWWPRATTPLRSPATTASAVIRGAATSARPISGSVCGIGSRPFAEQVSD